MFLKVVWSFIIGYVNIQIEGFYIERFINMCKAKSILLWGMDRKKSSILNANIAIKDFKRIKQIARKTKCKIKLQQKKGLPFIFQKYKKRKIFVILLALVFINIIASSQFVWNIEIKGLNTISKEEIMSELNEDGLKIGTYKNNMDIKKIINKIRLNRDDIAWLGIDVKGTNAIVEIVEADKKPEIIDATEYCNIVTEKSGIITKINVQNGTALVKPGDIVKPGDVLVEGKIQGKYTDAMYVHSVADIEAKIWYSKKVKANYIQEVETPTGKEETKYQIKFNNFVINLYKTLSKFENYDTINEYKRVSLFSDFYLPIELVKITNKEKEKYKKTYGKDELQNKTIQEVEEEIKKDIPKETNIVNRYVNVKEQEGYLDIEVVYEVLENIGTKEKLVI